MSNASPHLWRFPLSWTITSLCVAVSLHVAHLPLWITGGIALLCGWRILLAVRGSRLPSRAVKIAVLLGVLLAVLTAYRTLNGIAAGTALLALMAGMKLLETRESRDHVVVLLICYFLVLAAFLRDQSFWLLPFHGLAVWIATTSLLRVTQSHETLTPRECLSLSGRMLLQATPLMLVLFLFFPRIPGPFWALPGEERGTSGLSEEMNPGDISELTLSDDVAFRARFQGRAPPPSQRYWRGPVLHDFDGNIWRAARTFAVGGPVEYSGAKFDYTLMMEPSGRNWVFALDMAQSWQGRLYWAFDYQLRTSAPIDRPTTLQLSSRTSYAAGTHLSQTLRQLDTRLPSERNPRTRELAQRMRGAAASERDYIAAILRTFREQEFVYTLTPPKLDPDAVDDFLFNTRSGFCAHYASAFTMMMRAAGIPARVVTGYQGGEYNRLGEYWIVRQADAHAWSEVWLAGRGWVRVDPTAAVAPERIERGSAGLNGAGASAADRLLRESSWLSNLRYAWDTLNTAWRQRVLAFGSRSQMELLKRLGLDDGDWQALAVLLAGGLIVTMILLGILLARELEFRHIDPVVQAYRRFCRRLERRGIERLAHEGPLDFSRRVRRLRPDLAPQVDVITRLYLDLRYSDLANGEDSEELRRRVARFRPRSARPQSA